MADERAALRDRNLAFFRQRFPHVSDRATATPQVSRLVTDTDGRPDVGIDGRPFYGGRIDEQVAAQVRAFREQPSRFFLSDISPKALDAYVNRLRNAVLDQARDDGTLFLGSHAGRESYFLVVFGVGLGRHLAPLIEASRCHALILVEPRIDFLVHSLACIDWQETLAPVLARSGRVHLLVDGDAARLAQSVEEALRATNPAAIDGFSLFVHYPHDLFAGALEVLRSRADVFFHSLGHFYDEILMLKNAYGNLAIGGETVYRQLIKDRSFDVPVFIVACGPSLDEDIATIRRHADKAVVISCGTALRPLLMHGIRPDFQIEIENVLVIPIIEQVGAEHDFSDICLVAASTVDRQILEYFDDVVYYFRSGLSPYPLFCDAPDCCLKNPGPTVVNAALAFAQDSGFRDIYLFGVDLGVKGKRPHHSADSYHFTDGAIVIPHTVEFGIPVPANFGGTSLTSHGLFLARTLLSDSIAAFRSHAKTPPIIHNCSDGAQVEGTTPLKPAAVTVTAPAEEKAAVLGDLRAAFPVFSRGDFDAAWRRQDILAEIDRFMAEVEAIFDGTQSLFDKGYLDAFMRLLKPGLSLTTILEDRLENAVILVFRGTIYQCLMVGEFLLNRAVPADGRDRFEATLRRRMRETILRLGPLAKHVLADPESRALLDADFPPGAETPPTVPLAADRVSRNQPCLCGSGEKFKRCHGRPA